MHKLADKSAGATRLNEVPPDQEYGPERYKIPVSTQVAHGSTLGAQREEGNGVFPLRILHVVTHMIPGGTESVVLQVIGGLDSKYFDHRICSTRGFDRDFVSRHQVESKMFVVGRPGPHLQLSLLHLGRIMRSYKPHIVHSRNWGAIEAIPAARLARVPVAIHSEHGYELDMLDGIPLRRRVFRRAAFATADVVFAVTRDLREFHSRQAWFPSDRIRVIYNGVDTQRFAPCVDARLRRRTELGFPAESIVYGTVGRVAQLKDQGTLVRAVELLCRRGVDARILLVGKGPDMASLQRHVEGSAELAGRVVFTGASDQVPDLLRAMDVFVLPSLCEGMSNTLLEALACELPSVATRVGGNPEVIEEGRSGWLFSPGDSEELASLLHRLAASSELRSKLGAEARRRAVAHFSQERMLQEYRDLYLELARRRKLLTNRF